MDSRGAIALSALTGAGMTAAPVGVPHIRTSERKDFLTCQQKWVWGWRQGLKPRIEKPGALWFGTGMHLVLQHRYSKPGLARGMQPLKVWREYVGDTKAIVYDDDYADTGEFFDAMALGEEMIGNYLDHYGMDERWWIISAEQPFDLALPYPARSQREGVMAVYNGTFDLVARDQQSDDSLWVWDHKNVKSFIKPGTLRMDKQAGAYWAVAGDVLAARGLIEKGEKLDGILYNMLRKGKKDTRPMNADGLALNKDGSISKVQKAPLFHREVVWRTRAERKRQIQMIQDEATQMQAIREHMLVPTKNPQESCAWSCAFYEMCQLHEAGEDLTDFKRSTFKKQDPYADHR